MYVYAIKNRHVNIGLYSIRNRSYGKKVRVGPITRTIGHGYAKGVKVGFIT